MEPIITTITAAVALGAAAGLKDTNSVPAIWFLVLNESSLFSL